ncbi:S9 family peptidase [Aestuariibacter salexigens]|uniref:S9 family peptidase n=1 Tax=Aestuariibacter salexigens TaxID=226010 RepID=UPI00047EB688|nr:S9 family peptidase [Aestuariibacter salexigens]
MKCRIAVVLATWLVAACTKAPNTPPTQVPQPVITSFLQQLNTPAPEAKPIPYSAEYHGKRIDDPYHWLKDQSYPTVDDKDVLDYLHAENDYFNKWLAPHKKLVDTLFNEFKGRMVETDTSVPYEKDGYEFRWEFRKGDEYRTWLWRNLESGQEEVLLSEPELAKGHDYFVMGDWTLSSDHSFLAYTIDTSGDERYQLYVKDMRSGEVMMTAHDNIRDDVLFLKDTHTLVYGQLDPERWFTRSINVHSVGRDISEDRTLFTEHDDSFFLGFSQTSSEEFLLLTSEQRENNEVLAVPVADVKRPPLMLKSRQQGFYADVDHGNGDFYIIANDTHVNGRLAKVKDNTPDYASWQTLIEGADALYLRRLQVFADRMVLQERNNGIDQIRVMPNGGNDYYIAFPEPVYRASISYNPSFTQQHIRLSYESMITPDTIYDFEIDSRELITRKVKRIPSGYDSTDYVTERLMAPARDGAAVPISLVYKKGIKKDGSQPLLLYGYGAYGIAMSPTFSGTRLSLLERGFVFAIAHVRGGDDMGYQWYLDGKLEKRQNTFNDFIDVARHLIDEGYTAKGNISIVGGSAGGELVGAAVVQEPQLWRSATLAVPFVDVLNTMLDASLPLTPPEWQEWGNPIESETYFEVIKAYSPYDNIEKTSYPPMLVTGGLNDPRVTYWEPAKWTAKMRANKTDQNLLVMRMNMGAGHFANSGRYGSLKDDAEEYAFVLLAHGISE